MNRWSNRSVGMVEGLLRQVRHVPDQAARRTIASGRGSGSSRTRAGKAGEVRLHRAQVARIVMLVHQRREQSHLACACLPASHHRLSGRAGSAPRAAGTAIPDRRRGTRSPPAAVPGARRRAFRRAGTPRVRACTSGSAPRQAGLPILRLSLSTKTGRAGRSGATHPTARLKAFCDGCGRPGRHAEHDPRWRASSPGRGPARRPRAAASSRVLPLPVRPADDAKADRPGSSARARITAPRKRLCSRPPGRGCETPSGRGTRPGFRTALPPRQQ